MAMTTALDADVSVKVLIVPGSRPADAVSTQ